MEINAIILVGGIGRITEQIETVGKGSCLISKNGLFLYRLARHLIKLSFSRYINIGYFEKLKTGPSFF